MFRIDQIMSATQFIRTFRHVARFLARNPEPILITQRTGRFIVVMDGEFFDGLMRVRDRVSICNECKTDILDADSKAHNHHAFSETT
ncbi:MAG: hypothetical protein RL326_673 [Pseudomonadota bacterium]